MSVNVPFVPKVTLKFVLIPATRAALPGKVALASLEVIPTVSVTVFTRFQFASTARTDAFNGVPANWVEGAPLRPVGVPGAAVSPGASICSFAKAPTLTVMDGLVLLGIDA